MNAPTHAAIRAAARASGMRHGDTYSLAGPANAARRQALYSAITGRKCTRAESGVTAIRHALFEASAVTGGCLAERERHLAAWIEGDTQ